MKLKIKKNDTVKVISGDNKGDVGRVLLVDPKKMTVLVEGVNIHVKHTRPSQTNAQGGKVEMEFPIHYSNVMLLDSDKNATRVGSRIEKKGNKEVKVRYARTNDKEI